MLMIHLSSNHLKATDQKPLLLMHQDESEKVMSDLKKELTKFYSKVELFLKHGNKLYIKILQLKLQINHMRKSFWAKMLI